MGYLNGVVLVGASATDANYVGQEVQKFQAKLAETPITYEVAKKIASRAIAMADQAASIVRSGGSASLIGPAMIDGPREHMKWHVDNMVQELAGRDPRATPYERFADLRKWAAECYRALLTATQERDVMIAAMADAAFWQDVRDSIVNMPKAALDAIRAIPDAISRAATGLPLWVWSATAIGGIGLLGYGAYKILHATAPGVGQYAARRYLP